MTNPAAVHVLRSARKAGRTRDLGGSVLSRAHVPAPRVPGHHHTSTPAACFACLPILKPTTVRAGAAHSWLLHAAAATSVARPGELEGEADVMRLQCVRGTPARQAAGCLARVRSSSSSSSIPSPRPVSVRPPPPDGRFLPGFGSAFGCWLRPCRFLLQPFEQP